MAAAFSMRWKLDQPYIRAGQSEEVHALVAIEPNTTVLAAAGAPPTLPAHLFVLVDVSGSMDYLMRHERGRACKLILVTDGEDDQPERVRAEVSALAQAPGLPLAAFGMGECKVAFLAELVRATLAGSFHHIRDERDADQLFRQAAGQRNVVAVNAVLKLWLSPDMQVRDLYRTRPEILYVGDLVPDLSNVVKLPLEQLEKGKAYEFLFRCVVPRRAAGQRFRLAKATLVYDLPAWQRVGETVEANIVVEYTDSEEQARQRSGDVRRVLARAEVQRQVLFLQQKIDALKQGNA